MKTILLSLIFCSSIVYSQTINSLDLKNGFRNFKFGSTPSQIKNIIKQENQYSKNPRVATYDYFGNEIEYVANVKVDNVTLHFFDNKLMSVNVTFGKMETQTDFTLSDFNNIRIWLEQAYGKNWLTPNNSDGKIQNGAIWDGVKVRLELIRVDFSKSYSNPADYGFVSGYITIFDKNLNKQMFASDF